MKYVALLRGVNVGGVSVIKMRDLKKAAEKSGFANVITHIQSGNLVFESDEKDIQKIAYRLEDAVLKTFKIDSTAIVRTGDQLRKALTRVPSDWKKRDDLRRYIAFVREPTTARDIVREIQIKEGVDFVKAGEGVVYMSTLLGGLTKSGFSRLTSKKIYRDITIRNLNTVQKLVSLLDAGEKL